MLRHNSQNSIRFTIPAVKSEFGKIAFCVIVYRLLFCFYILPCIFILLGVLVMMIFCLLLYLLMLLLGLVVWVFVLLCYCIMWYVLFVVDEVSLSPFLCLSVAFLGQGPFEKETIVSI